MTKPYSSSPHQKTKSKFGGKITLLIKEKGLESPCLSCRTHALYPSRLHRVIRGSQHHRGRGRLHALQRPPRWSACLSGASVVRLLPSHHAMIHNVAHSRQQPKITDVRPGDGGVMREVSEMTAVQHVTRKIPTRDILIVFSQPGIPQSRVKFQFNTTSVAQVMNTLPA